MNPAVWRLNVDSKRSLSLIPRDLRYFTRNFVGKSMKSIWPNFDSFDIINKRGKLNDFVSWHISAPVVSDKVKNALSSVEHGIEFLYIASFKNKAYYAMNVLNVLDIVDFEKSSIFYPYPGADGVPNIIVLKRKLTLPYIFKCTGLNGYIYVTTECADILINNEITGFGLTTLSTNVLKMIVEHNRVNEHPELD